MLTLHGRHEEAVEVALPRFDVGDGPGGDAMRRGVPAIRVGGRLVTTVLDLMLATYGVAREGLPGDWPRATTTRRSRTRRRGRRRSPASTGGCAVQVAREFARNAEVSGGRSMICMGAGTNHWFHSDETYRSFLALLILCGLRGHQRRRLGALRRAGEDPHVRRLAAGRLRAGLARPPRQAQGTSFFYTHTEQWRYDRLRPERFASPLGSGASRA